MWWSEELAEMFSLKFWLKIVGTLLLIGAAIGGAIVWVLK